jgi:hypothetical protein
MILKWKNRVSASTARARLLAALMAAGVACTVGASVGAQAGIVVGEKETQSLPLGAVVPDSRTVGVVFPPSQYRPPGYGYGYSYSQPYGYWGSYGYYPGYLPFNSDRAFRQQLRAGQIESMRSLREGRR